MDDVTLLFGMGATKAGTTWLYRYLSAHPECHFRHLKELHYFNCAENHSFDWRSNALASKLTRLEGRLAFAPSKRQAALAGEIADIRDWLATFSQGDADHAAYLAYLEKGRVAQPVMGDITPAYAMVNEASLTAMASLASNVRFIYILRDPLARLWSNIRMAATRLKQRLGGDLDSHARDAMDRYLAGEHAGIEARSDYAYTIKALSSVVPAEAVHLTFFETLFTRAAADRITDFLGISQRPGQFEKVVHGGKPLAIDPDQKARALLRLRPQYEFVSDHFKGAIPQKWHDQMAEVA